MPLNSKVQIRDDGIHGHCWFAGEDIPKGEWIWKKRAAGAPHTDLFVTMAEINSWPIAKREKFLTLCYQVDDNLHCGFDPDKEPIYEELIEDYINHSCDGNTWYENPDLLVAMRDIKKGEEITYDYVQTECHPDFLLAEKCLCGASTCRGRVTGNDWKIPALREKYNTHFYPHVQKKVDEYEATLKKETVEEKKE